VQFVDGEHGIVHCISQHGIQWYGADRGWSCVCKKKYVWGWPTQKVGSVGSVSLCIALTPNG